MDLSPQVHQSQIMRRLIPLLTIVSMVLVSVEQVHSQPGGRGNQNFDPGELFDRMSGGRPELARSDVSELGRRFLDRLGITSERVTRNQFIKAQKKLIDQLQRDARGEPTERKPTPVTKPKTPDSAKTTSSSRRAPASTSNRTPTRTTQTSTASERERDRREAGRHFNRRDKNRDGVLDKDEMSSSLRKNLSRWDRNRNGKIEESEYTAYYLDYMARSRQAKEERYRSYLQKREDQRKAEEAPPERERPDVFFFGNLPEDLPDWFTEFDTDRDGQIGLYEWVDQEGDPEEFEAMDANGDGFVTPREMLEYEIAQKEAEDADAQK